MTSRRWTLTLGLTIALFAVAAYETLGGCPGGCQMGCMIQSTGCWIRTGALSTNTFTATIFENPVPDDWGIYTGTSTAFDQTNGACVQSPGGNRAINLANMHYDNYGNKDLDCQDIGILTTGAINTGLNDWIGGGTTNQHTGCDHGGSSSGGSSG